MTDKPALFMGFAAAQEKYLKELQLKILTKSMRRNIRHVCLLMLMLFVSYYVTPLLAGLLIRTGGFILLVLRGSWRLRDLFVNPRPVQYSVSVLVSTQWGQALYALLSYSLSLMLPVLLFFLIFNRGRERFLPRRRPKRSDFSVLLLLPGVMILCGILNQMILKALTFLFGIVAAPPALLEIYSLKTLGIGVVAYALLPALLEEYIFRGIVLKKLLVFGERWAVIVSALLFMIVHASPFQIVGPLAAGLILGYITVRSGSLLPAVGAHFVNNLQNVLIMYYSSPAVSPVLGTWYVVAGYVFFLVAAAAVFLMSRRAGDKGAPALSGSPFAGGRGSQARYIFLNWPFAAVALVWGFIMAYSFYFIR